jgi:hypothetical protein
MMTLIAAGLALVPRPLSPPEIYPGQVRRHRSQPRVLSLPRFPWPPRRTLRHPAPYCSTSVQISSSHIIGWPEPGDRVRREVATGFRPLLTRGDVSSRLIRKGTTMFSCYKVEAEGSVERVEVDSTMSGSSHAEKGCRRRKVMHRRIRNKAPACPRIPGCSARILMVRIGADGCRPWVLRPYLRKPASVAGSARRTCH